MTRVLLVALVMTAFAGNSVLNRLAVEDGAIGAEPFAVIRLVSGALALAALTVLRGRGPVCVGWIGPVALVAYMAGFYAGLSGARRGHGGADPVRRRPGGDARRRARLGRADRARALGGDGGRHGRARAAARAGRRCAAGRAGGAVGLAALGWGVYSLVGRRAADPLGETAANFIVATPLCLPLLLAGAGPVTAWGAALAVVSGAVTSGLGYALWYAVLPRLAASAAALAQLSVPLIALLGGAALVGEWPSPRFAPAALLILGGIALGLRRARRPA